MKSLILSIFLGLHGLSAGESDSDCIVLPSGSYFETIILDPTASQVNVSLWANTFAGKLDNKMLTSVNLGITRIILRWEREKYKGFELGLEYAVHSQFSVQGAGHNFLGGLQSADYRIAGIAHYKNRMHIYRMSLFHQSSHLGDDYIIRNDIVRPTSNVLNYEQLDIMRSSSINNSRYYYGLGYNISPNTIRKRISLQLGYYLNKDLKFKNGLGYFYGIDVKSFEQNKYRPGIKLGAGLEIGRHKSNPVRLIIEYYKGHMPYSIFEYKQVRSLGLGLYLNSHL